MLIKEYRIVLPLSLAEYQRGMLYAVAKQSRLESTDGADGVEFLENAPYTAREPGGSDGIFTRKNVHLGERLPKWASLVLPSTALSLQEQCWNEFPHVKTVYQCAFFEQRFQMSVESRHLEDNGLTDNVHGLDDKELKQRQIEVIDVTQPPQGDNDEHVAVDFSQWRSSKASRGPLTADWSVSGYTGPVMCCYKLVCAGQCRRGCDSWCCRCG